MVCPVSFPTPKGEGEPHLPDRMLAEIASLPPWHTLFLGEHSGRDPASPAFSRGRVSDSLPPRGPGYDAHSGEAMEGDW